MKNSRLLLIFNTFSKKEIRDLRKWLLSPAHNQRKDVQLLFEYLVKYAKNENDKALQKEKVYRKIFPTEEYDDARFRQTIHFLIKSIEEFLTFQELMSDNVRAATSLAKVYRKRGLDKLFTKAIKVTKELQEKSSFRNAGFQQNEFQIQLEEYAFRERKKRTAEMNLQKLTDSLDITYIANKLKYSCIMLAHQNLYKTDYNLGIIEPVLNHVEQKGYLSVPAISVYYFGYKTLIEKENTKHLENLKKVLFKSSHTFPISEAKDIYLMVINYLINRINSGNEFAYEELFETYKMGLKNGVFLEKGKLSRFTFRNIVAIGLKLSAFEWVDSFIKKYEPYLQDSYRENIAHFSKANLAYVKKDYHTAMQLLMQVEYKDTLMNLNAKNMLVKMLYEEDEFDTLESLLNSMRTYLTRKKVMGYHKGFITNFIKLTKKLLKVQPYNKVQIERLRTEIEEVKPMASTEREWLLTQLNYV